MTKKNLLITSLIGVLFLFISMILFRNLIPIATVILLESAAVIFTIYSVVALIEIWKSRKINKSEKWMWTIGFVFLTLISIVLYFFNRRDKVVEQNQLV